MDNQNLINALSSVIKQNGQNLITGDILQNVLVAIVNALGLGYQFMGVASTATDPGTPDQRVLYIAHATGTYSNFGTPAPQLDGTQVAIFTWDTAWHVTTIDVPTKTYIDATFVKISNLVQTLGDDPDKVISQLGMKTILEDFAKTDGWYSSLIAGSAEGLIGRSPVLSQFMFRQTKGGGAGNGTAVIQELRGNGLVWNQLVTDVYNSSEVYGITRTKVSNYCLHYSGLSTQSEGFTGTSVFNVIAGHKYYFAANGIPSTCRISESSIIGVSQVIYTPNFTGVTTFGVYIPSGVQIDADVYFVAIDLTLLFNGDIPGSYTVQKFNEMYPLLYYKPNTGQILPFAGNGVKTTGVNQWDEVWELDASNRVCSKNHIKVLGGNTYYMKIQDPGATIDCYDANYNKTSSIYGVLNSTFVVPNTASYIKFVCDESYGTTYRHDIQIAIYDATNPECMTYHPYEEHTLAFPDFTAMTGKVNGQGASEIMFGEVGLCKAGAAYNVLFVDQDGWCRRGQKRLARVNLEDLDWLSYAICPDGYAYYASVNDFKAGNADYQIGNVINSKYQVTSFSDANLLTAGGAKDKVFMGVSNSPRFIVRDTAYSTPDAFKAAMSGVYAYYELATPVDYVLDEPFYLGYPVNALGTEQIVPENTDEPYTAPSNFNTLYPMDAVGTIENLGKNFIKKSSMENILNAMVAAGKIASYTLTYNAADDDYDCTIS